MLESTDIILCKETMNSLISYAEHLTWNQTDASEVAELRDLVDTMEGYWGVDEEIDWVKKFDKNIEEVERGRKPEHLSKRQQAEAINGLYRYAIEMVDAQGLDAEAEIEKVGSLIKRLGNNWNISRTDEICCTINKQLENMQNQLKMKM